MELSYQINRLLGFGLRAGLLQPEDTTYCANRLLSKLGAREYDENAGGWDDLPADSPADILEKLTDYAAEHGKLENNSVVYRDIFDTELMDCLMPRPSQVIAEFNARYAKSPAQATDYYYALARSSNYIRTDRVKKDRKWEAETPYGKLVITINLSKPEKDPKAIAAAKLLPQTGYPKCALCRQNEGYMGSVSQAARANHRLVPLTLTGTTWYLQYSPYVYYNEHCILLNAEHKPMQIDRGTFTRELEFVTKFPHYFIGSNADLPIVGGSILSHDHFQGGRCDFPMAQAPIDHPVTFAGFEDVQAGLVRWPMSVIRLRGEKPERLIDLAEKILNTWRAYSDPAADILAYSEDTPHNTVTPIARRRGTAYEMDLVLRNNRTTEEYPLGIFHPHAQLHHIKKENIGLIEVMGLAILPARLLGELSELGTVLQNELTAWDKAGRPAQEAFCDAGTAAALQTEALEKHAVWFASLLPLCKNACAQQPLQAVLEHIPARIREEVGTIFAQVLADAGVYKDTPAGNKAFMRFIAQVNAAL